MHIAIDILAGILLLFAFLSGWQRGFLVSLLGVARLLLSYTAAYFSGRYLGFWLGELAHRPRIITIPIMALMAFTLVFFGFHLLMHRLLAQHRMKEEAEDYKRPILSHISGALIDFSIAIPSLVLLLWILEIFLLGIAGTPIPGIEKSYFGRFTQQCTFKALHSLLPDTLPPKQSTALARTLSNPSEAMRELEAIIKSGSFVQIRSNGQVFADIMSGDPEVIAANPAINALLNDHFTWVQLQEIGAISPSETHASFCNKLAALGRNEKIRKSFEQLQQRDVLRSEKIIDLLRDPDLDIIMGELIHPTAQEESPPPPVHHPSPSSTE